MTNGAGTRDERSGAAGVAQAVLALLPALVLAWPFGGPLEHDFAPRSTGFGLAALLSLPGIALFLFRRSAPSVRGSFLLVVPLLATAAWLGFGQPTDPFEASRATIAWVLVLVSFAMGAVSDPRTLARGAALVGLAAAASGFAASTGAAGAFGNAGATSEAATLGAGAGLALLVHDRIGWRALGGAAVIAFLLHAAQAPVLAGGVALASAALAGAIAQRGRARAIFAAFAIAAVLAVLVPVLGPEGGRAREAAPAAVDTSPASGVSVRAAVHGASARLLAAHPLAGVGPGQFPAQFPPFRDPAEIEKSSHGRLQAAETEVEHAHDDWIQPALELGLVAGLAWLAFLVLVARESWRALRSGDPHRAALGAGLVALLVHALARAPITSNAASATLFAAAAGALLARPVASAAAIPVARRFLWIAAAALLAMLAPRAWSLARHGIALQAFVDAAPDDSARRERAVAKAATIAPDSVLVRTLEARLAEAHGEPQALVAERWESVLALRPHRVEALVQLATARARGGNPDAARAALLAALDLDPGNPPALQNLATIELQDGELAQGLARLDRIPAARAPDAFWLRGLAARLALRGLEPESAAITARAEPARTDLSPEERYALARELRAASRGDLGDGWEARAHRAWADQHAAAGRWSECVRSLRQDLRLCLERPGVEPVRVRLALAAALHAAGRTEEAREQLAAIGQPPGARDLEALPAWTRDGLAALDVR